MLSNCLCKDHGTGQQVESSRRPLILSNKISITSNLANNSAKRRELCRCTKLTLLCVLLLLLIKLDWSTAMLQQTRLMHGTANQEKVEHRRVLVVAVGPVVRVVTFFSNFTIFSVFQMYSRRTSLACWCLPSTRRTEVGTSVWQATRRAPVEATMCNLTFSVSKSCASWSTLCSCSCR